MLFAEPHPLYRDALERLIAQEPTFDLVGSASEADELARMVEWLRPDVVLADGNLVDLTSGRSPPEPTRLLLLVAEVDPSDAYAALEAGATGYLSKDAGPDAIRSAITAVARGGTVLDKAAQSGVASEIQMRGHDDRPALSAREQEILVLVARGLTAPQIASQLHLSTATVKTHLIHLYDKLGVTERAAAVAEAMRRGLLE